MKCALKEAQKAFADGEVPIGAVVVLDGKVVSRGHNRRTKKQIATAHAEVEAIEKACKKLKSWRIPECEIYARAVPYVYGGNAQRSYKKMLFRCARSQGENVDCGNRRCQSIESRYRSRGRRYEGRVRGNFAKVFQRNAFAHKNRRV